MTIRSQHYAKLADDAYTKRIPGQERPQGENPLTTDGIGFQIIEHYDNPATGYQGTVYRRLGTDDLVVAHRGTEFDREAWQDGLADAGMVISRTNAQVQDAVNLTRRAIEYSEARRDDAGRFPEVTVTGHSLGGTLAQITAHRFNLRGEAFNPYGAASLGYGVPEGGERFVNHAMAGDAVSAASPHYGQVRLYARPAEIAALTTAGYGRFNPMRDNPLAATQLTLFATGSHNLDNFLDVDDDRQRRPSVLAHPGSRRLAGEHAFAIQDYRGDVRLMRGGLSLAGDVARHSAQRLPLRFGVEAPPPGPGFKQQWGEMPLSMSASNQAPTAPDTLRRPPANAGNHELFRYLCASLASGDPDTINRGLADISNADINCRFRQVVNERVDRQEAAERQALEQQREQQQEQQRMLPRGPRMH